MSQKDILPLVVEMYEFVRDFEGEVPGASPKDCGNYLDMNLGMAKYLAAKYLKVLTHIMSSRNPDWFIQNKGEYFAPLRGAVECNSFSTLCGMCYQHNCFPRHKAGALPYSKRRNNHEKTHILECKRSACLRGKRLYGLFQ
mgnify:CR=1 FL=1